LLEGAAGVFGGEAKAGPAEAAVDLKSLHAKIGQLALENDFLEGGAREGRIAERKAMIDGEHKLPIKRQAEALLISRGAAYYRPRPVSERDLLLMRSLDELHLNHPFRGQPDAARSAAATRPRRGPAACRHADGQNGHRGRSTVAQTRRSRRRDTGSTRIC
jgi:hypothetical protein